MRTYQVAFRDWSGNLVDLMDLSPAQELRFSENLNAYGAFSLTLPYSRVKAIHRTLDAFAQVLYADDAGAMNEAGTYQLRYFQPIEDDNGQTLMILAGVGLEHQLKRRIFHADDDPLVANGFSTKSGDAYTVLRSIIEDQCVNPASDSERVISLLALPSALTAGEFVAFREESSETSVLELLADKARAGMIDFWITYEDGPVFQLHLGTRGSDLRKSANYPNAPYLYFAPNLGNIQKPELTIDRREEGNYVYVFGQGTNGNRLIYGREGAEVYKTPWNRCEFGVQAQNAVSLDDWITEAQQALNEARAKLVSYRFEPGIGSRGATYLIDWQVGDLVTCGFEDLEYEMRITGAEVQIKGEGETVEPIIELYTGA